MPGPVGHAIAGLAVAWMADGSRRIARAGRRESRGGPRQSPKVMLWCVLAATVPDLDILLGSHRTYTHSLAAAVLAGTIAWLLARRTSARAAWVGLVIGAAYATHPLLDWLGKDSSTPPGLMALWPFSSTYYLSGFDLFPEISRRYWRPEEFIVGNLRAAVWEFLVLGPVAGLAWWGRQRRRSSDER